MTPNPNDDELTPLQAAGLYAEMGWQTVPIGPGKKYPEGLGRWQDHATDNPEVHRSWWTGLYRDHGIGILTGPKSDNWVLDVDRHDIDGEKALAELIAKHGDLPPTPTQITGGGGRHIFFQWDPDRPVVNVQGRRRARLLPPGLDVRGDGGQVVAAPTVHASGTPYIWAPGLAPWEVSVADAPDWLYPYLEFAEVEPRTTVERSGSGTGPADWFREHGASIPQILEHHDWTLERTLGNGDQLWLRPGKKHGEGHSAIYNPDEGPLRVFSTDASLEALWRQSRSRNDVVAALSPWDLFVATTYGGDVAAAIRHCERAGYVNPDEAWAEERYAPVEPPPNVDLETGEVLEEDEMPKAGLVQLSDWWDSNYEPKKADLLVRTDGVGLLYADQLNWIHGDSGSGKTWVAIHAAVQLINAGSGVLWVHYEDPNPGALVQRLQGLGLDRAAVLDGFHYYDPRGEPLNAEHVIASARSVGAKHVVLDSAGEALNASGVNEDSDAEVGPWITNGPRAIVNAGIGFTGIDHGTKEGKNELHPSGSKRKRAALTGAGLLVKALKPPTHDADGVMVLICAKDRHGNHAQGAKVGTMRLDHHLGDEIRLHVQPPIGQDDEDLERLISAACREAARKPGIGKRELEDSLPMASRDRRRAAIDIAINRGELRVEEGAQGRLGVVRVDVNTPFGVSEDKGK